MWGILTFFYVIILSVISNLILNSYNAPLVTEDAVSDNRTVFVGERAFKLLKKLNDIGSKEIGSYNCEILTLTALLNESYDIQEKAHKNQEIGIYAETFNGSTALSRPEKRVEYRELQELGLLLMGHDVEDIPKFILLGCNYDSKPGSPGGGDLFNCAVMLEILRVLSQQESKPKIHIVFLFNSGKESGLLGSQSFLRSLGADRNLKLFYEFINLESMGSGGKEMLFRLTPNNNWLIEHYQKSVKNPFGQTIANELFGNGLISIDSDFDVFQYYEDDGEVLRLDGVDFAHFKDGYRYQTEYDNTSFLTQNNLQYTGNNILNLVKSIANANELPDPSNNGTSVVYFDYLGLMLIVYPESVAGHLNNIVSLLAIVVPFGLLVYGKSHPVATIQFWKTVFATFTALVGLLSSVVVSSLIALVFGALGKTMSWYTHTINIAGVYGCASLLVNLLIYQISFAVYRKIFDGFDKSLDPKIYITGINAVLAVTVMGLTSLGIQSQYILTVILVFSTISQVLIYLMEKAQQYLVMRNYTCNGLLEKREKSSDKFIWIPLFYVTMIPLLLWTTYMYHILIELFVPLTGKSGATMNPDIAIGVLGSFFSYLTFIYFLPLFGMMKRKLVTYGFFFAIFAIFMYLATISVFGFPYSAKENYPTPQRHFITHVKREIYDEKGKLAMKDAGFIFEEVDFNSNKTIFKTIQKQQFLSHQNDKFCKLAPLCGYPAPSFEKATREYFLPTSMYPSKVNESELVLESKSAKESKLQFSLRGSTYTTIYIMGGISNLASNIIKWNGTDVEVVRFVYGLSKREPDSFYVIPHENSREIVITVSTKDYEIQRQGEMDQSFRTLLDYMPHWTFTVPASSVSKTYVYPVH